MIFPGFCINSSCVNCHAQCNVKTYGWFLCAALLGLSPSHWVLKALNAKFIWNGGGHQKKFPFNLQISLQMFDDVSHFHTSNVVILEGAGRGAVEVCCEKFMLLEDHCLFVLFKKKKITIITGNHCLNHNLGPREQCSCTNLLCYCFLKCYFRNKLWPYVLLWLR